MTSARQVVSLVKSPWTGRLQELVSLVDENLLIVTPFVKQLTTQRILAQLDRRGVSDSVRIGLITDLRPESTLAGSMELVALTELGERIPRFELTHLPSVHAKVYVADSKMAIVTSGNLTEPGVSGTSNTALRWWKRALSGR